MTNPRFRLRHGWILSLALSLVYGTGANGSQPDNQIDRLTKAYRAARTEFERRTVCLDAIDAGVLARDRSVAVVDTIFGTTWARKLPPAGGELEWGVVEFHPLPPPPSDTMSAVRIGWYLAFQFDSTGKVQNYYLTNVHK